MLSSDTVHTWPSPRRVTLPPRDRRPRPPARRRALSLRARRPRQPRRRGGHHADHLSQRVPLARAGGASAQAGELAADDRLERHKAAFPARPGAPETGGARRPDSGPSPEATVPTVGEILTALSRIPPQQRQAIVLREFEGRSYKEIAEILNVSVSALETLLFRARRSLADELEHQLTCTEAQFAVSQAADGRLGRKERRRLRVHLEDAPTAHSSRRPRNGIGGRFAGSCWFRSPSL